MTARAAKQSIQSVLGVTPDGDIGPKTRAAFERLHGTPDDAEWPPLTPAEQGGRSVKASSFADPADVAAFRKCKAKGKSDQECFKVGDNGVGCWGDDTTTSIPMCALPPEDMEERWGSVANAKHRRVIVRANNRTVECVLADRMPRRKNIKNGAGIDLSPAAVEAIGLKPPIFVDAVWQWA